jgi:prophage regulatory protein
MRILRMLGMQAKLGLSPSSVYELQATDPDFPKSIPLSENRVGWIEDEVDRWLERRVALRDNPDFKAKQKRQIKRRLARSTPTSTLGDAPLGTLLASKRGAP